MLAIRSFKFHGINLNQANIQRKDNTQNITNFNTSKLAPLEKDTVSFTGVVEMMEAINNKEVVKNVFDNAQYPQFMFANIVKKYFKDLEYAKDTNPEGLIEPIQARRKSIDSIREKIASRVEDAFSSSKDFNEKIFNPTDRESIKQILHDICGARIVMTNAFGENPSLILKRLTKMIEKEEMVVDSIENYLPQNNEDKYYSDEDLKELLAAVNKVRLANEIDPIEIKNSQKDSGYMALHLDFNIDNYAKRIPQGGYNAELQIMGADVAMLKEIEDFCYKLKSGKAIKGGHAAFTPFERFFLEAYNNTEKYPDLKEDFEKYTQMAYKFQRQRKASEKEADDVTNWAYKYPTINECGFEGKIPSMLDFNILARIKRSCDDLFYVRKHADRILAEINK